MHSKASEVRFMLYVGFLRKCSDKVTDNYRRRRAQNCSRGKLAGDDQTLLSDF